MLRGVRPNSMELCPSLVYGNHTSRTQSDTGFSILYGAPHSAFLNEPGLSADHESRGWAEKVTAWLPGHPGPELEMPQRTPSPWWGEVAQ